MRCQSQIVFVDRSMFFYCLTHAQMVVDAQRANPESFGLLKIPSANANRPTIARESPAIALDSPPYATHTYQCRGYTWLIAGNVSPSISSDH